MRLTPLSFSIIASFVTAAALFVAPAQAADLSSCGDAIQLDSNAMCTVVAKGPNCTAQCTPVSVEATCSAKLYASCQGGCNATVDASCSTSCSADCSTQCQVNPGTFDCSGSCSGRCDTDCTAECTSQGNSSECNAHCSANCKGECDAQCNGTPPSATCASKCQASCSGSCTAKATASCQIDCQAKGSADCEASVQGGCTTQCSKPEGAIFCNGQYLDATDVNSCVSALQSLLNINVTADGSASCSGGSCTAEGNVGASCSAAPGNTPFSGSAFAAAFGAFAVFAARRKRASR